MHDYEQILAPLGSDEIRSRLHQGERLRLVSLNPEMWLLARRDPEFGQAIAEADGVCADGIGMVWWYRLYGYASVERLPGIEVAQDILALRPRVALLGASSESLAGARDFLSAELGAEVVYSGSGFFEPAQEDAILGDILASQPQLVLIAMPFRRQEMLLRDLCRRGFQGACLGVGGSFDVWSGLVPRAPRAWQSMGLEWLWRLLRQPSRARRTLSMLVEFLPWLLMAAAQTSVRKLGALRQ
jgi:UDP-N-acetyl-D-mannosaminouronate:lipid I N-acetyl-D-mannosaminouronosyltransferase